MEEGTKRPYDKRKEAWRETLQRNLEVKRRMRRVIKILGDQTLISCYWNGSWFKIERKNHQKLKSTTRF